MNKKQLFNQQSNETFTEARILNGNPTGVFHFGKTNHTWAISVYQNMLARTWFPKQVDISKDKVNYRKMNEANRRSYDLALSQLIPNDSIQSNQLVDNVNRYITSPMVNACIIKQASEEVNHADSYTVMAEDICEDSDRIYNMAKHDKELALKNEAVSDMYSDIYDGDDPSVDDMLMVFGANQILEELVFPGGFVVFYALEKEMPGSSEMISEINKDETLSHVPLFKNIFRTTIKEEYQGIIPKYIEEKLTKLITKLTNAEIRWTKYMSKGLLGFSDRAITTYVEGQANSVCDNLGIPRIYETSKDNPLAELMKEHLKGGSISTREGFFEKNVTGYSKNTLVMDI